MSGLVPRSALTLVFAVLAVAFPASSGTAAVRSHGPMLGVIPHLGVHAASLAAVSTPSGPVLYHDGQVMHTNTVYTIFWAPSGHPMSATYEGLINRYFTDVAAASGTASNVYSVATQYYDTPAAIQYASTFGGSYVDTNPFPANGCSQATVCLTDPQLQAEIQRVLTATGWHAGTSTMFFLMTPNAVGSCFDVTGTECTTNAYCAYHSDFIDANGEHVIYADQPYDGTIQGCAGAPGQGFPNDHDADATINAISHEHMEAITDPFGDAWWANDGQGDEIADLCVGDFGTPQGTANGQPYNQVINGHAYSLQLEYSNDNAGCVPSYTPTSAPTQVSAPVLSGAAGVGQLLSATTGAYLHAPSGYAYQWQRCTSAGTGCTNVPGATAATYPLTSADVGHTVRVEVSAHNAIGTTAPAASTVSAVVVPAPQATGAPVLSGAAAVGKALSTTAGTWNTPGTFTYTWLRCRASGTGCTAIAGATSATYVATKADRGHTLEARVVATNAAGTTTAYSSHSRVVVGLPSARTAPRVSGRAHVGRRLSSSRGSWSGAPADYRYQWLRCGAHGTSCVRIRGATHRTYRVTKGDARHRLRVRVTARNAAGARVATSRATAAVSR